MTSQAPPALPGTRLFPASRYAVFAAVLMAALAWDLSSKWWVFDTLGYPHRQSQWQWETPFLWGKFTVTLMTSFNNGALWGLGQGHGWLFALLSVGAAVLIAWVLFVKGAARSLWFTVSMALIGSGALGNLYDRLYLHQCRDALTGKPLTGVRDFIKCDIPWISFRPPGLVAEWPWPIFNFADAFLVTGAIMLVLHALFTREEAAPKAADTTSSEASAAPPQQSLAACEG